VSAPKCRLLPLGTISSAVFLAKGAPAAKRRSSFKRNASRTLSLVCSYQRVVRSMNLTLESSDVLLWRERRAMVGRLAARAASCRANLLARSGQHTRLGLLSRPVRAQSSRRHKVEHLRPQTVSDRAISVAHDVIALGARNDTFSAIPTSTAACFVRFALLEEIVSDFLHKAFFAVKSCFRSSAAYCSL
jgi:hypothetical protein